MLQLSTMIRGLSLSEFLCKWFIFCYAIHGVYQMLMSGYVIEFMKTFFPLKYLCN